MFNLAGLSPASALSAGAALWQLMRAPLWVLVLAYVTWGMFLAAMALVAVRRAGTLPRAALVLGYPLVALGALCDIALQAVSTLPFGDLPREWFLTQRLGRYIAGADGWRKTAALWICRNLLDPFQVGGHCTGSQQQPVTTAEPVAPQPPATGA